MNRDLSYTVAVVMVCLLGSSTSVAAASDEAAVKAVLAEASRLLANLHSVQFTSNQVMRSTDEGMRRTGARKRESAFAMTFVARDGRFRSDASFTDGKTGKLTRIISLYDGHRHQFFDPSKSTLTISKGPRLPNTSVNVNPLVMPYMFLFAPGATQSLSRLRDPGFWDDLVQKAQWRGTARDDEHEYALVAFPIMNRGKKLTRVFYFAKDLGYFPIKSEIQTDDGSVLGRVRVTEYRKHSFEGKTVIIPVRSTWTAHTESGTLLYTLGNSIQPESLKLNEAIADEMFVIPVSQVDVLVDADVGIVLRPNSAYPLIEGGAGKMGTVLPDSRDSGYGESSRVPGMVPRSRQKAEEREPGPGGPRLLAERVPARANVGLSILAGAGIGVGVFVVLYILLLRGRRRPG